MKKKPFHILLVEDNPDHAEIVMHCLEEGQMIDKVLHLMDGKAALEYLFREGPYADSEDSPRPDLILLDLRLPKVSGLDVLKKIKDSQQVQTIPVVILTTSNAPADVNRAYEYHANSYLVKPVDFGKYADMLETLGFYWLGWNCRVA
ncbi:MAG: response regulator [Acidobacteriota bacterium]|nr:response regulator [Acidobacteriota bacterium]